MTEMPDKNKALMRRIYEEMWNKGDLTIASQIFSRPEGVQRAVSEFLAAFPDLQHTVEEVIAEGDRVVARFSAHGTHTGQWKRFVPTGKPIQYTGITLARIVADKIIEHHTWWDTMEVVEQIRGE
jgi:predicted ester cyclase